MSIFSRVEIEEGKNKLYVQYTCCTMYFNMIIVYSQKMHNLLEPLHHTMKYIFISKMFAYTKCIENYLSIIKTLSWDLINIFSSVYTFCGCLNAGHGFPTPYVVLYILSWDVVARLFLILVELFLSSSPVFSGVRVTRSLVLYVCFVDRCLSFCTFSFGRCVLCPFHRFTDSGYSFGIFKLFLTSLVKPFSP